MRRFTLPTHPILLAGVFAGLTLAGCAGPTSLAHAPAAGLFSDRSATTLTVPVASAAAMLPAGAGRIIQVTEQRYADGVSQQIVLAGDAASHGENRIDISFRLQPESDQIQDGTITMSRPSETQIARELESRFPNVAMAPVQVLLQNAYGPYGLAAGIRGNGERCIYGWQWIDDAGNVTGAIRNPAAAVFYGPTPVSVRVRLCRVGVSADALAGLMNDLVIGGVRPTGNVAATGGGPDALSLAGGAGAGFNGYVLPRSSALEPAPTRERVAVRHARSRRGHAARRTRHANAAYGAPIYPSAPPQPYAIPQPYPAAAYPAPTAPVYAPAPQSSRTLDQGLPPQAYQGPSAAGAARPAVPQQPGVPLYNRPPPTSYLQRDPVRAPSAGSSI